MRTRSVNTDAILAVSVAPYDQLEADLARLAAAAALINETMPRVLRSLMEIVRRNEAERALPVFVDMVEAMRLLGGVSRQTVYRLMDRGELESHSVAGRRMIYMESIERAGAQPARKRKAATPRSSSAVGGSESRPPGST